MSCRVAIVGGGPGGLMTAYQLQERIVLLAAEALLMAVQALPRI